MTLYVLSYITSGTADPSHPGFDHQKSNMYSPVVLFFRSQMCTEKQQGNLPPREGKLLTSMLTDPAKGQTHHLSLACAPSLGLQSFSFGPCVAISGICLRLKTETETAWRLFWLAGVSPEVSDLVLTQGLGIRYSIVFFKLHVKTIKGLSTNLKQNRTEEKRRR
jgi:hypothetical protein